MNGQSANKNERCEQWGYVKYGRERSYADVAAQSLPSNNRYHDRSQDRNYVRHCHSDEDDVYGWEVVGRKRH